MKNKISLAGDLGSGKSTVSKILTELTGAEYYSTGPIVRALAEKHGMTAKDFNVYMESHPEIDHYIDAGLKKLSDDERSLIIDSRMAWHFTDGTLKLYLSCELEVSALRIMNANRSGEHAATLEETIKETKARRDSERKRYLEQYGVDITDMFNYDFIIDTSYATPDVIAGAINKAYGEWKSVGSYKCVLLSPLRIRYPDRAPRRARLNEYSARIERGEKLPAVKVAERDGVYYLVSGLEAALAYAFSDCEFIPAKLVRADINTNSFVKMANML